MTVPQLTLNDGNTIPQLGFGVWQLSNDDVVPAVTTALETGYRHIDTAAIYKNEEGVGKAIAQSGIDRKDLFVTTKLWNNRHSDARAALEESLSKLGLDYVDLYLIHWPVPEQNKRLEAWSALEQAQADGLVKSLGVSNFRESDLYELAKNSSVRPVVNQIELHPTFTQVELSADNARYGAVTQAWSPLGRAHDLENPTVGQIAERIGRTPAQVVLRWHLQAGRIVFPKSATESRIRENFQVFDFALSDGDMAAINGLNADNRIGPHPMDLGAE